MTEVYAPTHARCSRCGVWARAEAVRILRGPASGRGRGLPSASLCPPCYAAWWAQEQQAAVIQERQGRGR